MVREPKFKICERVEVVAIHICDIVANPFLVDALGAGQTVTGFIAHYDLVSEDEVIYGVFLDDEEFNTGDSEDRVSTQFYEWQLRPETLLIEERKEQ